MTFDEAMLKEAKIRAKASDKHWDIQSDAYKQFMLDEAYKTQAWTFMVENKKLVRDMVEANWKHRERI